MIGESYDLVTDSPTKRIYEAVKRLSLIHIQMCIRDRVDDPSAITTEEVSEALGGLEISEQDNVSKVLSEMCIRDRDRRTQRDPG